MASWKSKEHLDLCSLLDPLEGLSMLSCGKLELEGRFRLPALKGVRRACQKSRDQTRKRDNYVVTRSCIQKPTTSWLELILHPFGVGTSHGRPWTHLTHHDPNSGEAITFPHIVFSALLRGTHIRMALFHGTPKEESRNCPGLNSRDFGHLISLARPSPMPSPPVLAHLHLEFAATVLPTTLSSREHKTPFPSPITGAVHFGTSFLSSGGLQNRPRRYCQRVGMDRFRQTH